MLACLCMALACGCKPRAGAPAPKAHAPAAEEASASKPIAYRDQVYEPHIFTPQLYRGDDPLSYPILYLGEDARLTLEFDALQTGEAQVESFIVDVVSCDHDWTPSGLLPLEFMEGFGTDRIYFENTSQNTLIPYVHYRHQFPGEGQRFKRSGNYLLRVYRNGSEEDLILTRRLVVADNKLQVTPSVGLARMAGDRRRLQRVEFAVELTTPLPGIFDPRTDLHVCVLQNFRWDNAVTEMQPLFVTGERLDYQLDAANNFEGGNEYRMADIRSTRFRTQNVKAIHNEDSIVRFEMVPDDARIRNVYYSRPDLNGGYFIQVQEYPNPGWEADYVFVRFALNWGTPIKGGEVYLIGRHNDWRLDAATNRMSYNAADMRYECELLLKQGVYDYAFALRDTATGRLDEAKFEGSHAETENYYTILVYYRPIGARSAELVGMRHVNFYER